MSIQGAFAGHAVCASGGAWINGVSLSDTDASFHPNVSGDEMGYAAAIENYITNAQNIGAALNADGFPDNPTPNPTTDPDPPNPAPAEAWGDLTATALPAQFSQSCEGLYQSGQQVELQGDDFQPGATVSITLTSPGSGAETNDFVAPVTTVTADENGSIDTVVTIPFDATGFSLGDSAGSAFFFDATGPGATAAEQDDNTMLTLVAPTSVCALVFPAASVTATVAGNDTPYLPIAGAVLEVTGEGLPTASTSSGTFAELDVAANGAVTCSTDEPASVSCSGGTISDLYPGAPYTVTEVAVPSGYAVPGPQTFSASTTGATTTVAIENSYLVGNFSTGSSAQDCQLCVLAPSSSGALSLSGSSKVKWGGVATVNSTSSSAITATGSSALSGITLFEGGGTHLTGSASVTTQTPTGVGSVSDPFYWYQFPSPSGSPNSVSLSGKSSATITPGVYAQISASGSATLTLSPGVYVVTGSMSVSGSATVSGSGVTIYLACSSYPTACPSGSVAGLSISGTATVTLIDGATGPGLGFAIEAARGSVATIATSGNSVLSIVGSMYMLNGTLSTSGSSMVEVNNGEMVIAEASATGSSIIDVQATQGVSSG